MIDINKLQEIKESMPSGSLKKIADKAGVHYQTVVSYFKGGSENIKVTEAVIEVYKEYQGKVKEVNNLKSFAA